MSSTGPGERATASGDNLSIREQLLDMAESIGRAVRAYSDNPDAPGQDDPISVFPDPTAPGMHTRADVKSKELPPDRDAAFRQAMAELGPGRSDDQGVKAVGLHRGYVAFLEAGRPGKELAEWWLMQFDADATPGVVILAATEERKLDKAERVEAATLLGIPESAVGQNEYEVFCQIATHAPGFKPAAVERCIPFAYDLEGNIIENVSEDESMFTFIGTLDGHTPVYAMKIPRTYRDESHQSYDQPNDRAKMRAVAQLVQRDGGSNEIGFYTSATYAPSRKIDAMRVEMVEPGVSIAIPNYGTQRLAKVKGLEKADPPVGQLAGEAYAIAQRLRDFWQQITSESFVVAERPDAE